MTLGMGGSAGRTVLHHEVTSNSTCQLVVVRVNSEHLVVVCVTVTLCHRDRQQALVDGFTVNVNRYWT